MPPEAALDPQQRALYGDILRPPSGYGFDCAVATTYSLDFETALVIPATLAFHAAESRQETLDSPLALLEGLERLAGRIAIYCEAGRIQGAPKGMNRLTALLEDTITEVAAPGGGAFHPKLWLLRFTAPGAAPRLRLALLSRNITRDVSWDLALSLDGDVAAEPDPANVALADLVAALPALAAGRATPRAAAAITADLATDVARAAWALPPGFDSVGFAVNGFGGTPWRPRVGRNLGIVSPFVNDGALMRLARRLAPEAVRLLARDDEIARLSEETRARFGRIDILDDLAETGDGEDAVGEAGGARGLHAKAFVTERWSTTEITVGSGNATSAALLDGRNVEVFATLAGATSRVGSMQDQFSPERLGRFLRSFLPHPPVESAAEEAADSRLEAALRALALSRLTLRCRRSGEGIRLTLEAEGGHSRADVDLTVWPLVLGPLHATNARQLGQAPLLLGTLAVRDVTRWLGFRLRDRETGIEMLVSLGADLVGLPGGRGAEILRSIIENRDAFLRYLRLLLADVSDPMAALLARGKAGAWGGGFASDDAPILEDLVRALSGDGRQLRDVERLVERLGHGAGEDGVPLIPEDFLALWKVFREVLPQARRRRETTDA
jgi:hypothetical protein